MLNTNVIFCLILLSLIGFNNVFFSQKNIQDINFHIKDEIFYPRNLDHFKNVKSINYSFYNIRNGDTSLVEKKHEKYDTNGNLIFRERNQTFDRNIKYVITYQNSKILQIKIQNERNNDVTSARKDFIYQKDSLIRINYFENNVQKDYTNFEFVADTLFVIKQSFLKPNQILEKIAYRYDSLGRVKEYLYYIDYIPQYQSYSMFFNYDDRYLLSHSLISSEENSKVIFTTQELDSLSGIWLNKTNGEIEQELKFTFNEKKDWIKCSGKIEWGVKLIYREIEYY